MAINSKIIFCKGIKMDKENMNVLTYSETDMLTLVNTSGIKIAEASNYSFIGKGDRDAIDVGLSISLTYEMLLQCNYIAFQNTNYCNKWYFAFVDKIQYLNNGAARIFYTVDIFHTWYDYWNAKACFVSREHVNDDIVGLHTIPESLETGEYICQNLSNSTDAGSNYMLSTQFVVALSSWPFDSAQPTNYHVYNGLFSGFLYLAFNSSEDLRLFLLDIQDETTGDPINSIFVVPSALTTLQSTDFQVLVTGKTWKAAWVPNTTSYINMGNFYITDIQTLDQDYIPINKKLLCYPYRYILVNNNAGSSFDYRYEWFTVKDNQENVPRCVFSVYGVISPGCSIKLFPQSYNEVQGSSFIPNYLYGLDAGKLPTCSWWNDPYTNWLTQNAVNMPLQALGNITNIAKGLTGNIGEATKGITGILGQVGEMYTHSLEPNTGKGGVNQGDLMFSSQRSFTFKRMSIRREYAEVIDNFLTKFGYQINRTKLPNQTGRTTFNYVKIGPGEIIGYQKDTHLAIPPADLVKINNLYERGITLWHNYSTLGDYTQSNTIVS